MPIENSLRPVRKRPVSYRGSFGRSEKRRADSSGSYRSRLSPTPLTPTPSIVFAPITPHGHHCRRHHRPPKDGLLPAAERSGTATGGGLWTMHSGQSTVKVDSRRWMVEGGWWRVYSGTVDSMVFNNHELSGFAWLRSSTGTFLRADFEYIFSFCLK